jgi:hypothetical protein
MVRRWQTLRTGGWQRSALINGSGAFTTGIVTLVVAVQRFAQGAWMVIVLIPILVWLFYKIHTHYTWLKRELSLEHYSLPRPRHNKVVVLAPGMHRGVIPALQFAKSISEDVQALYVEIDPEETPRVREEWERWGLDVPLVVLASPYRSLVEPVLKYIRYMDQIRPDDHVIVIIPEFVTPKLWEKLLHNHAGLLLKLALLFRRNVVVANVRYWVDGKDPHPPPDPTPVAEKRWVDGSRR